MSEKTIILGGGISGLSLAWKLAEAGVPVMGLVVSPGRLAQVRAHRLVALDRGGTQGYADIDTIRSEVAEARLFFERHDIPVIDVSRRSIEETAAAILVELRKRTS